MHGSEHSPGSCLLLHQTTEKLGILEEILVSEGYRLRHATDGQSAIEALQGSGVDLILVSSSVSPSVVEALSHSLSAQHGGPAPAIVALAHDGDDDIRPLLAAGAVDSLRAPFHRQEVEARLELHRERARFKQQLAAAQAELAREVAARRQAEAALQEAEESGLSLVANLSEAIYTADARGFVTYISPAIERLLGYQPSEVVGRHVSHFIRGTEPALLRSRIERVLAGQRVANEYQMITLSGELRWVRTSTQPVLSEGQVVGIQGVLTDITERKEAEERIREQNEFLTDVLESLTHPFYVVDAHDYSIVMANSAARVDSQVGTPTCYGLTHARSAPCNLDEHPCPVQEIKRTKRPAQVEHIHIDADGNARYYEVYGYPLLDEEGNVARVIEYTLDVTERTAAELALRDSERRYRQLLHALQEGIWVIDEEHRTTFVNPRMAEMLGYTIEEMVGKDLYFFLDERGTEITKRNMERRRRGIREQHDFELIRKDGSRIYTSMETSPITDEAGNYVGAIAGVQDITERRQAEEARQKSEALLKETQRLAQVGGWEFDVSTSRVTWTEEVYRIHDVPRDYEPSLEDVLASFHPDDRSGLEQAIERAIETGEPWELELRLLTRRGKELWVRAVGRAEQQEGRVTKLSGTVQDITERRRADEALREAMRAAEAARREEGQRRREAEQRRQVAESLAGVLAALNSNQPLEEVLDYIAVQARQLLGGQAAVIHVLERMVSHGLAYGQTSEDQGILWSRAVLERAMVAGEPVAIPDVSTLLAGESAAVCGNRKQGFLASWGHPYRALLAVPIVVKQQAYGGILLCYAEPQEFAQEQVELVTIFGDQVALAVENDRLRAQAEEAAAAAERSRLARDLHDSVTQALFSASLVAEVLPQVWRRNPEGAQQGLEELRLLTRSALAEMRTLLLELRPTALVEGKLNELLWQLTEATTGRTQLVPIFEIEPVPKLPPEVQVVFYRVAQEALHNVVKHAHANEVKVALHGPLQPPGDADGRWQGQLTLSVSDDGLGFAADQVRPDQLGLAIMRERAESIGAALTVAPRAQRGTQVTLVWTGG